MQVEAEGLRDQDPGGPRHHGIEVVGASHAGAEGAQCAVGAGVAVRAEDELSRPHMLLQHDLVADTLALVEGDPVLPGKVAHLLLGCGCLHAVTGDVVVHDPDQLAHIRDPGMLQFVVHIDGQMGGAVVGHEKVQLHSVDVSRPDLRLSGCSGDDLFSDRHSHGSVLLIQ